MTKPSVEGFCDSEFSELEAIFDKAIKSVIDLLSLTNVYVDEQAPWSLKKTDPERMKIVLFAVSIIIIKSTIMLFPIIPKSAEKVLSFFNLDIKDITFDKLELFNNKDIQINKPEPIFPRID